MIDILDKAINEIKKLQSVGVSELASETITENEVSYMADSLKAITDARNLLEKQRLRLHKKHNVEVWY